MNDKVLEWVGEVARLSSIASSQPHAAYAALTHGLISKWTYLMRKVQGIGDLFEPLEKAIRQDFLPALTGRTGLSDLERNLLEMPARLGCLGIFSPTKCAVFQYHSSLKTRLQRRHTPRCLMLVLSHKVSLREATY